MLRLRLSGVRNGRWADEQPLRKNTCGHKRPLPCIACKLSARLSHWRRKRGKGSKRSVVYLEPDLTGSLESRANARGRNADREGESGGAHRVIHSFGVWIAHDVCPARGKPASLPPTAVGVLRVFMNLLIQVLKTKLMLSWKSGVLAHGTPRFGLPGGLGRLAVRLLIPINRVEPNLCEPNFNPSFLKLPRCSSFRTTPPPYQRQPPRVQEHRPLPRNAVD